MSHKPIISVLLPTFNQAKFLPDALDSLDAQTFRDFELIACNDGSTDETADILKQRNVRTVTHEENHGTAAAINSAFALSRGELVTWVSSDNRMYPNWLATLVKCFDDPTVAAVYSDYDRYDCFGGKSRPHLHQNGDYNPWRLLSSLECYFGPSFLLRRAAWLKHRDGLAHDYDWWLRVEEAVPENSIRYCPQSLCEYRMGPWQTGRNRPGLLDDARRWNLEARGRRG